MTPHCNSIQELLAAESSLERPWSAPLEDHLQACESCAAFAERLTWTMGTLRELPALEAPAELHGRVVSACQAGFAEDRAVAELSCLETVPAPAELDRGILQLFEEIEHEGVLDQGVQAPAALEERVAKDLADLPKTVSRHTLEKLPRLETPELLTDRLDDELPASLPLVHSFRRWAAAAASVAAAAGIMWAVNAGFNTSPGETESNFALRAPDADPIAAERPYSFEVVRPSNISELSNQALSLATSVTGGMDLHAASANRVAVEDMNSSGRDSSGTADPLDPNGRGTTQNSVAGQGTGTTTQTNRAEFGSTTPFVPGSQGGPAYFAALADAPFVQAYRGVRDVTIHVDFLGMSSQLVYREEVASNGAGSFTIEPLQVITPAMDTYDEERFLLYQDARESFFFRHRDFRIRNATLFWENYKVQDLAMTQVVAGRTCDTLLITRKDGIGNQFTVAIDPATSLVMQERRTAKDGSLVSVVEYQTFELQPDVSDLQLSSTQSLWTESTLDELPQIVSGELMIPVAPPQGFELLAVGYRTNAGLGQDQTWVQLTYGDGVEQAFFLFREKHQTPNSGLPQNLMDPMEEDVVRSLPVGPWSVLDGRAGGRDVVAAGRVTEADLLLMLQSSLD